MAVFYTAASLSGAFSGLLAYAIEQMDGTAGLGGWQWIVSPCSSFKTHITKRCWLTNPTLYYSSSSKVSYQSL